MTDALGTLSRVMLGLFAVTWVYACYSFVDDDSAETFLRFLGVMLSLGVSLALIGWLLERSDADPEGRRAEADEAAEELGGRPMALILTATAAFLFPIFFTLLAMAAAKMLERLLEVYDPLW